MTSDILIGLDAGTSTMKAVAFAPDGSELAAAAVPNVYATTRDGAATQDLAATWMAAARVLRKLAEQLPDLPARTACIAVTGQGDGTWLVDGAGEPVGEAMLWLDARAAAIARDFAADAGHAAHYALTGTGINACSQAAQLAWLKHTDPERLAAAATAFHCKDWLYLKLSGERATDPSEAVFTYGDYRTRTYDRSVLERLGIADLSHLLPPIVDGAAGAGRLTAEAAGETGFLAGTPVSLGYVDVVCSALGGGLRDPDTAVGCSILGSTAMHMRLATDPADVRLNPQCSGYVMAFPGGGLAQMQSSMAATINIDWLLGLAQESAALCGQPLDRASLLRALETPVQDASPAAALYHPYILEAGERGPFMNAEARAQFTGLSTRVGFASLMRTVLEGLALAARDCYDQMGPMPSEIRVTGGAARSPVLRMILASVLNTPIRSIERDETGAAGAVMIATVGLGLHANVGDAARVFVTPRLGIVTPPDPELTGIYDRQFPIYRSVRQHMPPTWHAMAEARASRAGTEAGR